MTAGEMQQDRAPRTVRHAMKLLRASADWRAGSKRRELRWRRRANELRQLSDSVRAMTGRCGNGGEQILPPDRRATLTRRLRAAAHGAQRAMLRSVAVRRRSRWPLRHHRRSAPAGNEIGQKPCGTAGRGCALVARQSQHTAADGRSGRLRALSEGRPAPETTTTAAAPPPGRRQLCRSRRWPKRNRRGESAAARVSSPMPRRYARQQLSRMAAPTSSRSSPRRCNNDRVHLVLLRSGLAVRPSDCSGSMDDGRGTKLRSGLQSPWMTRSPVRHRTGKSSRCSEL